MAEVTMTQSFNTDRRHRLDQQENYTVTTENSGPAPLEIYIGSATHKRDLTIIRILEFTAIACVVVATCAAAFAARHLEEAAAAARYEGILAFGLLLLLTVIVLLRVLVARPDDPLTDRDIQALMKAVNSEGGEFIAQYLVAIKAEGREPCQEEFDRILEHQRSLRRQWLANTGQPDADPVSA